mgnify:CR=1 FL=1
MFYLRHGKWSLEMTPSFTYSAKREGVNEEMEDERNLVDFQERAFLKHQHATVGYWSFYVHICVVHVIFGQIQPCFISHLYNMHSCYMYYMKYNTTQLSFLICNRSSYQHKWYSSVLWFDDILRRSFKVIKIMFFLFFVPFLFCTPLYFSACWWALCWRVRPKNYVGSHYSVYSWCFGFYSWCFISYSWFRLCLVFMTRTLFFT